MKVNGTRVEDLAGTGVVTKQRYVVPLWVSGLGVTLAFLGQVTWVLVRWAVRAWLLTLPAVLTALAYWRGGLLGVLALSLSRRRRACCGRTGGRHRSPGSRSSVPAACGAGTSRIGAAGTRRWTGPA